MSLNPCYAWRSLTTRSLLAHSCFSTSFKCTICLSNSFSSCIFKHALGALPFLWVGRNSLPSLVYPSFHHKGLTLRRHCFLFVLLLLVLGGHRSTSSASLSSSKVLLSSECAPWCTLHFIIKGWLWEGIVLCVLLLFVLGDTEVPLPAKSLCLPAESCSPLNALPGVLFISSLRMLGHKCLLHPLLCNSECLVVRRLWMVCMAPWALHNTKCTWAQWLQSYKECLLPWPFAFGFCLCLLPWAFAFCLFFFALAFWRLPMATKIWCSYLEDDDFRPIAGQTFQNTP